MSWVCPYCKRQHNEIAGFAYVNGIEVNGFCSDSCKQAYVAEHAADKSNPSGFKAKKSRNIVAAILCCPLNFLTCIGAEGNFRRGGCGLCFDCRDCCSK
jgi:hypothetical protein